MLWSSVKQLRSIAETELSVDDIFDYLMKDFPGDGEMVKRAQAHIKSKKVKATTGRKVEPFICMQRDVATKVLYREIPLPW